MKNKSKVSMSQAVRRVIPIFSAKLTVLSGLNCLALFFFLANIFNRSDSQFYVFGITAAIYLLTEPVYPRFNHRLSWYEKPLFNGRR